MICAANGLPCFKDLIAVLFECFSIISLGYLSCRFKLVSSQAKDLNSYLTNLALPMIIFLNIAQMEFRTINLSFLLCVLAAKLLVFLTVTLLTLTISYPTNFGYAGSLSILATQSNDFALGYPLIKLLYGESRPEMLNYLSLMAPIQLLILNPLGIAMLEFQKSKNHKKRVQLREQQTGSDIDDNNNNESPQDRSCCRPCERSNQLVVATTANHQHERGQSDRMEASNSYALNESTKSGSPTRLLEVADLLQTNTTGLMSHHQSKSSSHQAQPSLQQPSINCLRAATEPKLLSRSLSHDDEQQRRLKSRQKNVKSLVLAMPASELHSRQHNQQVATSEGESDRELRRRSSTVEPVLNLTSPPTVQTSDVSFASDTGVDDKISSGKPNSAAVVDEIDKRRHSSHSGHPDVIIVGGSTHKSKLDLSFFKALATNPLILASIVALMVNLIHGPELPKYVTRVSNTIAASFAAPALFVVGLSMYGKFELLLRNPRDLLLSTVMVLTKGLLLPSLVRTIALLVVPSFTPAEDVPYLVDFAFLYGLLPTAPTACIIAKQYGVLQNVVSISMLLSTIMAGPLTLASSVIISPTSVISVADIENVITQTMEILAVLTLFLAPFTLYTFLKSSPSNSSLTTYRNLLHASRRAASNSIKKLSRANPIRVFVFLLALSQIMISIGGLLWFFIDTTELNANSQHYPSAPQHPDELHNIIDHPPTELDESLNESDASIVTVSTSEPQILGKLHTSHWLSPRKSWLTDHHMELGYKTLSSLRYVFSAGGLMMAQFCILSLVLVIAATKLRDQATGRRLSELLLKACLSVLVCLVVWLVYDSEQLVHLPVEASLPSSIQSLCIRLLYNVAILAISLPLYALLIRVDNRSRETAKRQLTADNDSTSRASGGKSVADIGTRASSEAELDRVNTFVKRRFVTSSASLSSSASSAATSNTNLDSTLSSGPYLEGSPANHAANPMATAAADSLSIILDTKPQQESTLRPISPVEALALSPDTHIFGPAYVSSLASSPTSSQHHQDQQPTNVIIVDSNNNGNQPKDLEKGGDGKQRHHHHHHGRSPFDLSEDEFNQYSILIVFMLINSTLNLFSVAQKLLHEEPVGTFRQIEVIGVAFEFGQGLLTFLLYGTKGLYDWVLCRGIRNCRRNS